MLGFNTKSGRIKGEAGCASNTPEPLTKFNTGGIEMAKSSLPNFPLTEQDRGCILRLWARVNIGAPNECWEWQGCRDKNGYGSIGYGQGAMRAHRVAWATANGRLPHFDLCILHSCDNPPCCNPSHLREGTNLDNIKDRMAKGRSTRTRAVVLKAHCKYGHAFSETNTKYRIGINGRKYRVCRTCKRKLNNEWKQRKRLGGAAPSEG